MKIIFKIAKNEFRYLFYSPIAWFVVIVFLVQCAIFYTSAIYYFANVQDIMQKNSPAFRQVDTAITHTIFITVGIFSNVIQNLYLFIPILTMGLISRETNSGSVKILYSSPVRLRQIVFGKYLGIVLYNMLLVSILGIFMIAGVFNIRNADYGLLLSAALGFYLLVCAYAAIGLFMSSLSTYQIVSALGTFAIIFILTYIGGLWQRYDFVRDLTYFLSLQNRTMKMLNGLIVSRDVIYFIIVSCMFVAFTLIKLKSGTEAKPWYIKTGRYIAVIATVLFIGYISSRPTLTGYLDTTASQSNTIPKEMQKLLKEFGDSTLEVTLYTNLLSKDLNHALPEVRNSEYLAIMWERFLRFKPDIKFKYEYYYDYDANADDSTLYKNHPAKSLEQIAEESADVIDYPLSFFKSPEEMHKIMNLKPEGYRVVMQLKYRGRVEWLRTYDDPEPEKFWPDYGNVSAVIKHLLYPDKIPKIYFATGEWERSIYKTGEREFAEHTALITNKGALINTGYDVDTLNLTTQNIPSDTWALELADPKSAISPLVLNKFKNYIDNGGNMIIMGEPNKQYVLNPFLKQFGIQLMPGQLVQPTYDETPDKILPYMTAASSGLSWALEWTKTKQGLILMPGTAPINYKDKDNEFKEEPLLMTLPGRTWLKAGNLIIDSTLPPFDSLQGDFKQSTFATSVQLTRQINNKKQRIIICGDADFASNSRLSTPGYTEYNDLFLKSLYSWISYNEFPIYMSSIMPKDTLVNISEPAAKMQKIIFIWVLPGVLLLTASILLLRRKRK